MLKHERQSRILELIRSRAISRQEELIQLLEADNFAVNQSGVSRDLLELGILKVKGVYTIPQSANGEGLLSLIPIGENLIVAKCEPGLASAVCVKIDRKNFPEIAGTIAGDDTIFIAVKNAKSQKAATRKIREVFGI